MEPERASFKKIPLATWPRATLFRSYKNFVESRFALSFEADISPLYRLAKTRGDSFFLLTLFAISKAYNAVPEMRRRFFSDDAVIEFDVCRPSTPLMCADGESFRQTTLPFRPTFAEFAASAAPIVAAVRRGDVPAEEHDVPAGSASRDIFCASCVPWLEAAGYVPATFTHGQDLHVLTWFKMSASGKVLINSTFNHCFTDGLHAARFFNAIAENFRTPESL